MEEKPQSSPDEPYEPPAYELIGSVEELTMGGQGFTDDATALQPGSID